MNKWDKRFLEVAKQIASWSKDPNKSVGCVVVDDDHNQLSGGYNGFPRGVADDARLSDHDIKLKIIVHAEANAVATAARNGHSLKGGTIYCTFPPCSQCASLLIQTGIKRVVSLNPPMQSKWMPDILLAQQLFKEAGVEYAQQT